MSLADIVGVDVIELTISGVNGSGISGDGDDYDIQGFCGESVAIEVETRDETLLTAVAVVEVETTVKRVTAEDFVFFFFGLKPDLWRRVYSGSSLSPMLITIRN